MPLFPVFCWVTCLFPTIHHQELLLLLVKSHVKLQSSTCSCCLPTMILVISSHLTLNCYQLSRFYEYLMPCLLLWALQLAYHTVVATCLNSDMGGGGGQSCCTGCPQFTLLIIGAADGLHVSSLKSCCPVLLDSLLTIRVIIGSIRCGWVICPFFFHHYMKNFIIQITQLFAHRGHKPAPGPFPIEQPTALPASERLRSLTDELSTQKSQFTAITTAI